MRGHPIEIIYILFIHLYLLINLLTLFQSTVNGIGGDFPLSK